MESRPPLDPTKRTSGARVLMLTVALVALGAVISLLGGNQRPRGCCPTAPPAGSPWGGTPSSCGCSSGCPEEASPTPFPVEREP